MELKRERHERNFCAIFQFPDEHEAIDKYINILDRIGPVDMVYGALKWLPLWLCWILSKSGLLHLFTKAFKKDFESPPMTLSVN